MGKTYGVPRSAKGESRFLYVFTVRSLITTLIFAAVGLVLYFILSFIGLGGIGMIGIVLFAGIGFAVGTLTIPDSPIVGNLRKAGGEKVSEILIRTATFSKRKKIYIYREGYRK